MRVLIACEESGKVRDAFVLKGHDAWSCDLQPGRGEFTDNHIQGDVLDILDNGWDMMIAHPVCKYLTNSGVRWLHTETGRWTKMRDGAEFFLKLKNANIKRKCIENPIPHKYAREIIGKYTQIIQPWMFGHMESKATCLWLEGLEPITETNNVKDEMMKLPKNIRNKVHYMTPGPDRERLRSETLHGIADAFAEQWS